MGYIWRVLARVPTTGIMNKFKRIWYLGNNDYVNDETRSLHLMYNINSWLEKKTNTQLLTSYTLSSEIPVNECTRSVVYLESSRQYTIQPSLWLLNVPPSTGSYNCKVTEGLQYQTSCLHSYRHENSVHILDFHPQAPREDENHVVDISE